MLTEFFFFGVHESSLFDIPAVACILTLALFMLNKKWIVYATVALYILELPPDIRADMASIKMAGKRLSNQINNMLDYTEIVEGTLIPAKKEYMITSVLNDVITMTALQSNRQHLELVFDIDPKVPAVLVGDAEKISHVLKILVENAIKFTEEGGVNVRIRCRWESYGINLIVDIRDTGIGMTDAQPTQGIPEIAAQPYADPCVYRPDGI